MAKDVIIACDFPNGKEVFNFLDKFGKKRPFVKIGMELFYSEGPEIVREIKRRGHKIFLDLKLHDIPNTVGQAMKVLSNLDVDMTNVHASGGSEMMKKALVGLTRADGTRRPILIAVTELTSTDQNTLNSELLVNEKVEDAVMHFAKLANTSGLDGVVCSPLEASAVHKTCGDNFLTVTPGVRFADGDMGDQKRVTTPSMARKMGSDYIVVGRPITKAENPVLAYERVCKEFLGE